MAHFYPLQISMLENTMRRVIGTVLILSPLSRSWLLLFWVYCSDRWASTSTGPQRGASYIAMAFSIFALCACLMGGVHLRRN